MEYSLPYLKRKKRGVWSAEGLRELSKKVAATAWGTTLELRAPLWGLGVVVYVRYPSQRKEPLPASRGADPGYGNGNRAES